MTSGSACLMASFKAYSVWFERDKWPVVNGFQMAGGGMPEINRACKLSDVILRQLIIKHPQMLFDANVAALTSAAPEETAAGFNSLKRYAFVSIVYSD